MALGTTNISLSTVKSTIGCSVFSLFTNCSFEQPTPGHTTGINKWSRYKPVRDAGVGTNWPATTGSKYGLNLPTNWNYLAPRGGSPGGSPDEPGRLGDFRGYEHNPDIAGPVIYCDTTDVHVPTNLIPTLTDNNATQTGEFMFKCNQSPHGSVMILPSDLGIENYYVGIKLTQGANSWYKTPGAQVHDITTGQEVHFDAWLIDMDPVTFDDFPNATLGTWTWYLFISSSYTTTYTWSTSVPSNYIQLPGATGETWGAKTIQSQGSFTMKAYLIVTTDAAGTTPAIELIWPYNNVDPKDVYIWTNEVVTKGPGINASCISGGYIQSHWDWQGHQALTPFNHLAMSDWENGCRIEIWPITDSHDATYKDGVDVVFGLDATNNAETYTESQYTFHLVHEDGSPVSIAWAIGNEESYTFDGTRGVDSGHVIRHPLDGLGNVEIGINYITFTIMLSSGNNANEPVEIYDVTDGHRVNAITDTIHIESDGKMTGADPTISEETFTLESPHVWTPGHNYRITIGTTSV